jgi:hypothetical protein
VILFVDHDRAQVDTGRRVDSSSEERGLGQEDGLDAGLPPGANELEQATAI